jgi:pimeloyl-ACP methyl ester carboxylesterase
MADDTAALLQHLGIAEADVFGYSLGGGIALQLAIRHPEVVRKLVVASAGYTSNSMHAVTLEMFPSITPEHRARRLQRQLEALGYTVTLEQTEPSEQAA